MRSKLAIIHGVTAGVGGLGLQAATAITSMAAGESDVHVFGPGSVRSWPLAGGAPAVSWHLSPRTLPSWTSRYTWWRWYPGHLQLQRDRLLGRWAKRENTRLKPDVCYTFTQVGLETLRWARRAGIPTVLDSPTGHIRHYRDVIQKEATFWYGSHCSDHPTGSMVERVEEEYDLADRIRVSSEWAKTSMTARGVAAGKIVVIPQPLNSRRFHPRLDDLSLSGPLKVCYVGIFNLAKGFVYLLRAIRSLGAGQANIEMVGGTGNRSTRRLLERESKGLDLRAWAGDPLPAYHRADIFVLPSLHDGFGFVAAEAMACGLPVIVTHNCGVASWVRDRETGWTITAGSVEALIVALKDAISRRQDLVGMGRLARTDLERHADPVCLTQLRSWVLSM